MPDTYEDEDENPVMQERPKGTSPPCDKCPKGIRIKDEVFPDDFGLYQLSDASERTLRLYHRAKTPGFEIPERLRNDALFADRFAIVDRVHQEFDRERNRKELATDIAQFFIGR